MSDLEAKLLEMAELQTGWDEMQALLREAAKALRDHDELRDALAIEENAHAETTRLAEDQGRRLAEKDDLITSLRASIVDAVAKVDAMTALAPAAIDTETVAWAWLEKRFGTESDDPVDRAYAADEMIDAFHAGAVHRRAQGDDAAAV